MTMLQTPPRVRTPTPEQVPDTHPSLLWRKLWSIVLGLGALALLVLTSAAVYNVADTYGSIFTGGWALLFALSLGITYLMGAIAVTLWSRPGTSHLGRRSAMVLASTFVVVFVVMWFVGPLY